MYFHCLKTPRSRLLDDGPEVTFECQLLLKFPARCPTAIRLSKVVLKAEKYDTPFQRLL